MIFKKNLVLNTMIVLGYYFTYFFLLNGISGGDLFLLFLFGCSILFHFIVLLGLYHKDKKLLWQSTLGVLLGIFIVLSFHLLENKIKEHKKSKVEITN
jgi:hypothetical protein